MDHEYICDAAGMKINVCAVSDIGRERTNNEDAVAVCSDLSRRMWGSLSTDGYVTLASCGAVAIVADGMGGTNAGEIASALAIKCIKDAFDHADCAKIIESESSIYAFLKECMAKSNQAICDYAVKFPESMGLGTTIVMLWVVNAKAYIVWCGDSRCYCFNPDSGLALLTKDHSFVQELVDKGEISAKDAFCHPDNNIITRCLGDVDAGGEPEILTYDIKDGDIFLLCTDGLCGYCRDSQIENLLYRHYENVGDCLNSLLEMALQAGGEDNISISLCAALPQNSEPPKVGFLEKLKRFFYRS